METSPTKPVTLEKIRTEMKRVAKSQKRVFVQLSLLFLLPLSIGTALLQTLKPIIIFKETTNLNTNIFIALSAYPVALIFSICGTSSITFTTFRGFNDEPTTLKAALKSISASFLPLLATTLPFHAITFFAAFIFMAVVEVLGFEHMYDLIWFFALVLIIIAAVMYFQVNWVVAYCVVVVESRWGFEALKRSKGLIYGKRWVALRLVGAFVAYYLLSWIGSTLGTTSVDTSYLISTVLFILANTFLLTMFQLSFVVATTVLYAFCQESQRVVAGDGFSGEYSSLPAGDENISSVF